MPKTTSLKHWISLRCDNLRLSCSLCSITKVKLFIPMMNVVEQTIFIFFKVSWTLTVLDFTSFTSLLTTEQSY